MNLRFSLFILRLLAPPEESKGEQERLMACKQVSPEQGVARDWADAKRKSGPPDGRSPTVRAVNLGRPSLFPAVA